MIAHAIPHPRESVGKDLAIVLLVGVLVRAVVYWLFDFQVNLRSGDSAYYLEVGRSIVERGVHGVAAGPTTFRAPFYSLVAGLIASGAETAAFFFLVQGALYVGFALAAYSLLYQSGRRIAFVSALLIAASPFDALYNGRVLSENIVTPLVALGTLVFATASGWRGCALSGSILGLAALTRDIYVLLPLYFVAFGLLFGLRKKALAIFLLAFVFVISPWVYRNSQVSTERVLLSGGTLWTGLWLGIWERDPTWTRRPDTLPPEAYRTYKNGAEPEVPYKAWMYGDQAKLREIATSYMRERPGEVLLAWVSRYPYLWFGTRSDLFTTRAPGGSLPWYLVKATFFALNALLLLAAVLGVIVALRSRVLPGALLVPVLYTATIYVPFHNTETRYSQPVLPLLEMFAACLVLQLEALLRGDRRHLGEVVDGTPVIRR